MSTSHSELFVNRRQSFGIAGGAFSLLPLMSLLANERRQTGAPAANGIGRVSRVVFLFMNGGPSHLDTFDPKPALEKYDGLDYEGEVKVHTGSRVAGTLWKSEFSYRRCGASGLEISEIYPELSRFADDLCIIRSMHTTDALHAPAMLRMNTGRSDLKGASLGAWLDYGLGAINENLPHFAIMLDPRGGPISGDGNWSTGALPISSASVINSPQQPFRNLDRSAPISAQSDERMRRLLTTLNAHRMDSTISNPDLVQRSRAYELAWKMQSEVPEVADISRETAATQMRFGLGDPETQDFGGRCLLARRLLEAGVRFVQIYSGGGQQQDTWDAHVGNVARHRKFARETDRPIAALLEDLKATGLWDETLVIWGGEFGRTPTREKSSNGRDHNPHGFSMWLAGGAVRGGHVVGATDEIGLEAVETPCSVADLHATVLHLLGIDHDSLAIYQDGLEKRLTGPEPCRVIREVLA